MSFDYDLFKKESINDYIPLIYAFIFILAFVEGTVFAFTLAFAFVMGVKKL